MEAGNTVAVYMDLEGKCLRGLDPEHYNDSCRFQHADRRSGKPPQHAMPGDSPLPDRLLFLGNGQALLGRKAVYSVPNEKLSGVGVMMTEPLYPGMSLSDGGSGLWESLAPSLYLQAEPSIVAARVTVHDMPVGGRVLDMCAAPGGKAFAMADATEGRMDVYALDRLSGKVRPHLHLGDLLLSPLVIASLSQDAHRHRHTYLQKIITPTPTQALAHTFTFHIPNVWLGAACETGVNLHTPLPLWPFSPAMFIHPSRGLGFDMSVAIAGDPCHSRRRAARVHKRVPICL